MVQKVAQFFIYPTLLRIFLAMRWAVKYDDHVKSYFSAMKSLPEIASFLRERLKNNKVSQRELGEDAGIARRTLTGVLSGEADYKVTTLMAVLDRLGYELAIVPKGAAAGLGGEGSFAPTPPTVKTVVHAARERLKSLPLSESAAKLKVLSLNPAFTERLVKKDKK